MMQRMLFYFCALGSICFGLLGCGRSHPSYPGANLVIISIDTLRADRLPAYGGTVETPALDRLFADSVVFDKAFAQCPLTLPSHATMFTGLLPTSHGVRDNLSYRLNEESITLAEQLSERGYEVRTTALDEFLKAGGAAKCLTLRTTESRLA